jgi:glycosyltransferase involved in cell wall biosynthesis
MDPVTGGPCQGIRNLASVESSIQREVACLDSPISSYLGQDNFIIHALGPARTPWKYNVKLYFWLLNNIPRFDVVVVDGLWLYHVYAAWKAWEKVKKENKAYPKFYIMPHGMLDPWFQKSNRRKLKSARNWLYWNMLEKKIVNSADGLLFTCENELLLARETFNSYFPKKEINIGYGIQEPPYNNSSIEVSLKEVKTFDSAIPYLLYLGRVDEKKGVDILIEAYLSLKDEGLKLPHLIVAGPGMESKYGLRLKKIARNDNDIVFTGMLVGKDKWSVLSNSEAFILPSHQENFGIAVVEALACSIPVLISNQVNIYREIELGGGGIISNDTLQGTKHLIRSWIALETSTKNRMASNAYLVYKKNFEVSSIARRMLEILSN